MSQLNVDEIRDASGGDTTEYVGVNTAKAWVSFEGTGTVSINDSYNVDSITDNGAGDYDVNFTSALANNDYAVSCNRNDAADATTRTASFVSNTASNVQVVSKSEGTPGLTDASVQVIVFGGQP